MPRPLFHRTKNSRLLIRRLFLIFFFLSFAHSTKFKRPPYTSLFSFVFFVLFVVPRFSHFTKPKLRA